MAAKQNDTHFQVGTAVLTCIVLGDVALGRMLADVMAGPSAQELEPRGFLMDMDP